MKTISPEAANLAKSEFLTNNSTPPEAQPVSRVLDVLVAEGNMVNQKLIAHLLEKHGNRVALVENGNEALSAYVNGSFDLILMDVQMPEMGGFEATASIRSLEDGQEVHTPIIALTAHALSGDREECIRMGMDDYLSKPIQERKLIETVVKWTSGPRKDQPRDAEEETLPQFAKDHELFSEMVEALKINAPALVKRIQDAVEARDADALRAAAHTVKGSLSNFGRNRATRTALRIEDLARNRDLGPVREASRELALDVEHLICYLTTALNSNASDLASKEPWSGLPHFC